MTSPNRSRPNELAYQSTHEHLAYGWRTVCRFVNMLAMNDPDNVGPVRARPSNKVIRAFARSEDPVPLHGGRGLAWRVGDLVLKPADLGPELEWQAEVLPSVRADRFRIALPQRAANGALVVDGWAAWSYVAGEHRPGRWADVIAVGERFHRVIAEFPRPTFIATRTDPWAIGDRVVWGEAPVDPYRHIEQVSRLVEVLKPVTDASQLVHGDLTGNILFDDRLPPAVIDVSLYWRPPAFASAIVVADALVWEGADATLLSAVAHVDRFGQFLARALLYRIVAAVGGGFEATDSDLEDRYRPAVDLAVTLARRHRIDTTEV